MSDLFTDTPPAEKPAVQPAVGALHRQTTVPTDAGREGSTDTTLPGAGETCGTCGAWGELANGFGNCDHLRKCTSTSPKAACSFTPSRWVAVSAESISRRDAQRGIDQAAAAADRRQRGWTEMAFEFVKLFALQNRGKQYIGHDIVRASCVRGIIQPENPKAWGQPIQRASREGLIKRVGFAPDPNRHTNPVPLWESA